MSEKLEQENQNMRKRIKRMRRRILRERMTGKAEGFLAGVIATLRPGDLVVDCGANVGEVTTRLASSGADVVAFEPDPWAFEQVSAVAADLPNVTTVNAAVGAEAGELMLFRAAGFEDDPKGASVSSTIVPGKKNVDQAGTGTLVEVIDFPAWCEARLAEGRRIAMIKIDIEGAELDLMEAMFAANLPDRVGPILVETHEKQFPAERARFDALRETAATYPAGRVNLDWI